MYIDVHPTVGAHVEIFWPVGNTFYPGNVAAIDENRRHLINYADGDENVVNNTEETMRFQLKLRLHVLLQPRSLMLPVANSLLFPSY